MGEGDRDGKDDCRLDGTERLRAEDRVVIHMESLFQKKVNEGWRKSSRI